MAICDAYKYTDSHHERKHAVFGYLPPARLIPAACRADTEKIRYSVFYRSAAAVDTTAGTCLWEGLARCQARLNSGTRSLSTLSVSFAFARVAGLYDSVGGVASR